jgi:hypothetical protein
LIVPSLLSFFCPDPSLPVEGKQGPEGRDKSRGIQSRKNSRDKEINSRLTLLGLDPSPPVYAKNRKNSRDGQEDCISYN